MAFPEYMYLEVFLKKTLETALFSWWAGPKRKGHYSGDPSTPDAGTFAIDAKIKKKYSY